MKALKQKIETILNDESKLSDFAFFFKREINERSLTLVNMKEILERVSLYADKTKFVRYRYEEEQVLLVVNVERLEKICVAVLENSSLHFSITLQEFKEKYTSQLLSDNRGSGQFKDVVSMYQDGDDRSEFISSRTSWRHLCGHTSVVLKRNGEQVVGILKRMN